MVYYKYRSLSGDSRKFTEDILVNSRMFFATPDQFNDPFEFIAEISLQANRIELAEYFRQSNFDQMEMLENFSNKQFDEYVQPVLEGKNALGWHDVLKKLKEKYAVLCLSNCNKNINMWSHYGDNHKGVCFEFESIESDDIFTHAREVKYDLEPPKINIVSEYIDTEKRKKISEKIVYHKFSSAWDKESEWRIVCNQKGVQSFPFKSLKTIYLGCCFPLSDPFIDVIKKFRPDVDVVLMKKSHNRFELEEKWRCKPDKILS